MAPTLWELLKVKTTTASSDKLVSLLHPQNGILPHVRIIKITCELDEFGADPRPGFEAIVQLIVSALPRNRLRKYISNPVTSVSLLLHILQCQQQLEVLLLPPISRGFMEDFSIAAHYSWLSPTLAKVKAIGTYLQEGDSEAFKYSNYIVRNLPGLRHMYLSCDIGFAPLVHATDGMDVFGGPYPGEPTAKQLHLQKLDFTHITFAIQPTLLLSYVDVSRLNTVVLRQCCQLGLLLALALAFSYACSLTELEISAPAEDNPSEVTIQAYEAVFNSVSGLRRLWLNVAKGRMVNSSCVTRHDRTLRIVSDRIGTLSQSL